MKKIHNNRWARQLHFAKAGVKAGMGWAKDGLATYAITDVSVRKAARLQAAEQRADQWVRELGHLKGGVVKAGQILATYGDYCLPAPLAEALHQLEADTVPISWLVLQSHVAASLGDRIDALTIEPVALAAASLSQVHKAKIDGKRGFICLKILYPEIKTVLENDFLLLKKYVSLWGGSKSDRQQIAKKIAEVGSLILKEIDTEREIENLARWRVRLSADPRYIVPVVKPEFYSSDVVAMSFESGYSVNSIEVRSLSQHRRNELAAAMLELLLREILLWGEMQTDPHAGNYLIRINKNTKDAIVLLDFGSVRLIDPQLLLPLQKMLLAAYHEDQVRLCDGLIEAGFIAADAPTEIKQAFSDVLMGLIEPLNYKRKRQFHKCIPQDAVDEHGNYCWQAARLPTRMGKQALRSAFSEHFEFPGADFMLIARKLAGVYSFIAALDARIDGGIVMDKIIAEMRC